MKLLAPPFIFLIFGRLFLVFLGQQARHDADFACEGSPLMKGKNKGKHLE
jgi:hypothetical protein